MKNPLKNCNIFFKKDPQASYLKVFFSVKKISLVKYVLQQKKRIKVSLRVIQKRGFNVVLSLNLLLA